MKKNISIVRNGLVIDVGRFERSHVKGWVGIYSKGGERIGGFDLSSNKLKVIDKHLMGDDLHLLYSIVDRRLSNEY